MLKCMVTNHDTMPFPKASGIGCIGPTYSDPKSCLCHKPQFRPRPAAGGPNHPLSPKPKAFSHRLLITTSVVKRNWSHMMNVP